ncbi:MAG TPA: formate dehydrogenase subunit delta [Steroidobacteraceae bacterium]|nr:formate dehydrogenase subunit delta [Steroidobacteraceae bacterium]
MNIDLLIKMTNEIGEFFLGADSKDPQAAARDVANHINRYWEPRMRAQMLKYYEERGGAGLTDLGKSAVALLHAASKAAAPGPAAAPTKSAGP